MGSFANKITVLVFGGRVDRLFPGHCEKKTPRKHDHYELRLSIIQTVHDTVLFLILSSSSAIFESAIHIESSNISILSINYQQGNSLLVELFLLTVTQ